MILELYTKKFGNQNVLIDDEDQVKIQSYNWFLWSTKRHYGIYVIGRLKDKRTQPIRLHRLILNAEVGQIVDHINGNPLDNRKSNLRIVTSTVNNQNARKRKDGVSSKFKGVSYSASERKWKCQIQINKQKIHLGVYLSEIEAAKTYNRALEFYDIQSPRNKVE